MVKIRQKVSGCLRTLTGAEQFCAIRSYLATIAKHGIDLLDALTPPHQPTPLAALRSLNSTHAILKQLTSHMETCVSVRDYGRPREPANGAAR